MCFGFDICFFVMGVCRVYVCFNVVVGDGEDDVFGSFVFCIILFNIICIIVV